MFGTPESSIVMYILLVLLLLFLTIVFALVYSGLLTGITVKAGKPPIDAVTIAYKYVKGPYNTAGRYFTDVAKLAAKSDSNLKCLGIYYDDPKVVAPNDLRFIVALILSENRSPIDETLQETAVSEGYKIMNLPSIGHAVTSQFPYRSFMSIFIAIARVYPQLDEYIKNLRLCAHPCIEIYDSDYIYFMVPLSRQEEFYPKEVAFMPHLFVASGSNTSQDTSLDSPSSDTHVASASRVSVTSSQPHVTSASRVSVASSQAQVASASRVSVASVSRTSVAPSNVPVSPVSLIVSSATDLPSDSCSTATSSFTGSSTVTESSGGTESSDNAPVEHLEEITEEPGSESSFEEVVDVEN